MSKRHKSVPSTPSQKKQMYKVVIRFVGRFVFAWSDDYEHVHITAANMQFNDVISGCAHRTLLTAPLAAFEDGQKASIPSRRPDDRVVTGELDSQLMPKPVEYATWDLAGLHLELPDVHPPVTWSNRDLLPNISDKGKSHFDVGCVTSKNSCSPVATSMTVKGGSFAVASGGNSIQWGVFGSPTGGTGSMQATALYVDLTVQVSDVLWFVIRRRTDGAGSAIALDAKTASAGVPIVISNVCAGAVHDGGPDPEFAAFYDMLIAPPVVTKRPIPYVTKTRIMGAECYFASQAQF